MTRLVRFVAALILAYMLGFLAFALFPPGPAGNEKTDAIVVLTGGEGRVPHALDVLRQGLSPHLFVAGVNRKVRPGEFAAEYKAGGLMNRITLDTKSTDTISNASEAGFWLSSRKLRTVRLITSDWHMRRAALELRRVTPPGTEIVTDAVHSRPSFEILVLEYHKFLARVPSALKAG